MTLRLFLDILDLIFNKGVSFFVVGKLFLLFIPTVLPLTLPMAALLACLITFGRLSEENELTAVRAAGISVDRTVWLPILFSLFVSLGMIPFNTNVAPWSSRAFREIYEKMATADPLISIEPKKVFVLKNIKIYAEFVDKSDKTMRNLFVYELSSDGSPAQRIFARTGRVQSTPNGIKFVFQSGQMQRYDTNDPTRLMHTSFATYEITIPMKEEEKSTSTRFRNIRSSELNKLITTMKSQNLPTAPLEAEYHLRYAVAFASLSLVIMGIPLATTLKKGGKGVGFGVSIMVLFVYYTFLIFGLTLGEKRVLPPPLALWMGNMVCLVTGSILFFRMRKT
jgi:LPS export ABC transporter permease LptF